MLGRRTRTVHALAEDPRGDFMVGRLLGAAEMAALHLRLAGGDLERYGDQLAGIVGWFLETEPVAETWPSLRREAVTEIKPRPLRD